MPLSHRRKWIDVTIPLKSGMVHWPNDPEVKIRRIKDMNKKDHCNVSHLSLGSHTATHMDSPLHFLRDGRSLDQMPLTATVGPAKVFIIRDQEAIKVKEIKRLKMRKGDRILFKTTNSNRCWRSNRFFEDFVYMTKEAAQFLAEQGVQTIGVDYLSVGGFKKDGIQTHQILLKKGIWIIEGLNLAKIKEGKYDLICLPLKIFNSDGAPARVILSPKF